MLNLTSTFRRRLIRTLFILPVLLCLAAWALSTTHTACLIYSHAGTTTGLQLRHADLHFTCNKSEFSLPDGWYCLVDPAPFHLFDTRLLRLSSSFLGFAYHHETLKLDDPEIALSWTSLHIPLWFPLLVSSGLLWVAWRKTPRIPIQPGAPHA